MTSVNGENIEKAIQAAIKAEISRAVDEEVQAAKTRLEERIPQLAAQIAISVQSYFDAMGADTVLQIRVGRILKVI